MEREKPDREELRRFRAEAEELLGLTETLSEGKENMKETMNKGAGSREQGSEGRRRGGNHPSTP